MDTTLDGLLNRRVAVEQPAQGFRIAIDTVLLAAAVPAVAGDRVVDFGCGVGGAMLCLACRVPDIAVTGFEIQTELAALCRANIARNALQAEMAVVEDDVTQPFMGAFNHIMMNPPYHDEARHSVSDNAGKRMANSERDGDLGLWISSAARAVTHDGMATIIHRADRRGEIIAGLSPFFGTIDVLPILHKNGAAPKRIIVRARKGGSGTVTECQPLILHKEDGGFTDDAEDILRHAKPLLVERVMP